MRAAGVGVLPIHDLVLHTVVFVGANRVLAFRRTAQDAYAGIGDAVTGNGVVFAGLRIVGLRAKSVQVNGRLTAGVHHLVVGDGVVVAAGVDPS